MAIAGHTFEEVHPSKEDLQFCLFKVEVIAPDNTGCINLLPWDSEAKTLCGKSADKVKQEKVERQDDYPSNLNKMLNRKLLTKIH
ncbi:hypothetical protein PIB30_057569, partial [Stylosanthes scabra]|nr:hypothetical protein [Stylosanthes scabra]